MYALVITGPPGAGKTSVLEALSDQLVVEDVRHASVEVEASRDCERDRDHRLEELNGDFHDSPSIYRPRRRRWS